eukprot:snap_masked-scaffold564_size136232-processed-gene-0.21 protein:Tk11653 transcript:snap_masked-scaffold564_size136232-processed-gene-0.21-mRNA-1 annotation:"chromosome-associated kinesin kif4a-like isoform 3"
MNEKIATQVKKLSGDINQMKHTKVKLIKLIREDAEKVRVRKQQKEREVIKLKQTERKQQVNMVKMETLHSNQQIVVKLKMEKAISSNKRLKEVIDKQKASRAMLAGRGGLAGAGERVLRNLINEDLDAVVSVKEATQSREQLLKDRKTITKELNTIKKDMRGTMTALDMEAMKTKTEELQAAMDIQNAQISALQKHITDLEHDNKDSNKNRFDNFKTMTEAKIALEHLFKKTVEQTVYSSHLKSEFEELRQLYLKNTNTLEKEIADLKNEYETEQLRLNRGHEENVLFLFHISLGHLGIQIRHRFLGEEEIREAVGIQGYILVSLEGFQVPVSIVQRSGGPLRVHVPHQSELLRTHIIGLGDIVGNPLGSSLTQVHSIALFTPELEKELGSMETSHGEPSQWKDSIPGAFISKSISAVTSTETRTKDGNLRPVMKCPFSSVTKICRSHISADLNPNLSAYRNTNIRHIEA